MSVATRETIFRDSPPPPINPVQTDPRSDLVPRSEDQKPSRALEALTVAMEFFIDPKNAYYFIDVLEQIEDQKVFEGLRPAERSQAVAMLLETAIKNLALGGRFLLSPMIIEQVTQIAVTFDRATAQRTLLNYNLAIATKDPHELLMADEFVSKKAFQEHEIPVTYHNGVASFVYLGTPVILPLSMTELQAKGVTPEDLKEGLIFNEVSCGLGGFLETQRGQAVTFVYLNTKTSLAVKKLGYIQAEAMSIQAFTEQNHYGEPVSLESMQAYAHDEAFELFLREFLNPTGNLINGINLNVLPVFARVRLREWLQFSSDQDQKVDSQINQARLEQLKAIVQIPKVSIIEVLELFQVIKIDQIESVLSFLEYLAIKEVTTPELETTPGWVKRLLYYTGVLGSLTPNVMGKDYDSSHLIEKRMALQLSEMSQLDRDQLTIDDLDLIVHAQVSLYSVAMTAAQRHRQEPISLTDIYKAPPDFLIRLFDFSGRFPEAKTIFQTFFDLATNNYMLQQTQAKYAGRVDQLKAEFYQTYNQANQMGKEAVTTETETDLSRTESLIRYEVKEGRLPEQPRVLFVGCGNCQRFEAPLLRRLAPEIDFSEVVGVDLNDVRADIPSDIDLKFYQTNVIKEGLAAETGKFDIVVIPWSMINDLIEKESLLKALQVFNDLVSDDGIMILDLPVPIGEHSYAETNDAQAADLGIWGLMERDFEMPDGSSVRSIFDIMHIREMVMHLIQAGFLPTSPNFPLQLDELHQFCERLNQDDSFLQANHRAGLDADAVKYPFWQTGGDEPYNRVTMAVRKTSQAEITAKTGFLPSLLVNLAFASVKSQSKD